MDRTSGFQWNLNIQDGKMRARSIYIFSLDPMLDYANIASMIMEKYGNFSYKFCHFPLVLGGKNGSDSVEFLCRKCIRKMSM